MEGDGWIAGLVCAFLEEMMAIFKLQKAGRIQETLEIYHWFLPLLELDINPKLVQNIKLAEVATGLGTENIRAPRLPLIGTERYHVMKVLENGIKNRPALPKFNQLELMGDDRTRYKCECVYLG